MPNLLIIGKESKTLVKLKNSLAQSGFACSVASPDEDVTELVSRHSPDLLLVEVNTRSGAWEFVSKLKRESPLPVIALVSGEIPQDADGYLEVDDFLTSPYDARELAVRAQRLLNKGKRAESGELIRSENLVIDMTNCDVTVGGKIVELTFKEYELLKLLAANKGRVYTREDLLNKIWGYEYYGGDRTVDVHIRRLRSKIEGPTDTFIETVRNIGYRFKKGT